MTPLPSTNDSAQKVKMKLDLEQELEHISKEMYGRNLQLREINKTLSLLRKIDEIISSSVTDIEEVAKQVTNTITKETAFKAIYIFSINKKAHLLEPLARSLTKSVVDIDPNFQRAMYSIKILLSDNNNPIVKVIEEKKPEITTDMFSIFGNYLNKEACENIQKVLGMKYFYVYPLIMREEITGAMMISAGDEKEPYLTYQKDLIERLPSVVSVAIDNAMLYQNIQHTNLRLKELDKLKDEFVSLASHELRTPMTAIKSYLWMVLNKYSNELTPQVKSYLDITYQETERLIKLVQNMLTISRIEGERLELNIQSTNLNELVNRVFEELKIKAKEKSINLNLVSYPEKLTSNIDKDKIEEVLENIIGNAIKYTPNNGTVSIYFTVEENEVLIHVSDTGLGISKEDLSKLFTKFGRLEQAKQSQTQGTGLGLYISKQIIELHKGTIKVYSEVGKGTTFSISLPLSQLEV